VFFFKIVFAILALLHFHTNSRISLSISAKKKSIWDVDSDCLDSLNQFEGEQYI